MRFVPSVVTLFVTVALAFCLSSCASLDYYSQAIGGQLELMRNAKPITAVIGDPRQPEAVRQKLRVAREAMSFSQTELQLPRNRSYESYVDLDRPAVVWNVIASPALSVVPLQWCYPVAGCFSYRGYFSRKDAENYAADLRRSGHDVHVAGASAYSTLGWFDDPILSSMLRRSEEDLIATIFHERAHQRLHIAGDSAFNEAFAVTVSEEGLRRWYGERPEVFAGYAENQRRLSAVNELLLGTRERLSALYREPVSDAEKFSRKRAILDGLHEEYALLKQSWGGVDRFDGWFPRNLNNAHLALTATYQGLVPALKALLARENGDLKRFYAAARALGELPFQVRRARLESLLAAPALQTASN
jgi:predicted aminopeptidase